MSALELSDGAAFDARLGAIETENAVLLGAAPKRCPCLALRLARAAAPRARCLC